MVITFKKWLVKKMMKTPFVLLGFLCCLGALFPSAQCSAQDYTFSWSSNAEPIEGYRLHYKKGGAAALPFDGTGAGGGSSPITVGKVTTYTITGLDADAVYHFALTAYNGTDESGYSEIITIDPNESGSTVPVPQLFNIRKN